MPLAKALPFLGMNNRLPQERLVVPKEGEYLSSAVNVDITDVGTIQRRAGTEIVTAGADCHSFWSDGVIGFMVDGTVLYRLTSATSKVNIATVTPGRQFSYAKVNNDVYASNGVHFLRIDSSGTVSTVGIDLPATIPSVTAQSGGALPEGLYQIAVSHSRPDGEESGTSVPVGVSVPANGALVLQNIPLRAGYTTNIYVTPTNGDVFYLAGVASSSSFVLPTLVAEGPRPSALLLAPLPGGTIVRYLNGRLLVAAGNTLYYSEPYYLSVYNPARNYIQFAEAITMVEPCQNGFYLSADQTYWVAGDVSIAELNPVLPYKAVMGTSSQVPNANGVWWMSERGAVMGTQDGQVKNLQEDKVAVDPGIVGASLYREQDGMKQMVSTLFGPQTTVMAASSFMDAEVIRKETIL